MCRKNQLYGCGLIAFGLGLLLGDCFSSEFAGFCVGVALVGVGLWCVSKK